MPSQAAAETSEPHTNGHHNHALRPQPNRPNQEPTTSSNGATPHHHQPQEAVHHSQHLAQSKAGREPMQHSGQSQEDAAAAGQLVDALFSVLQQPLLPSTCLWQVGWLLSQLLAHAQADTSQLVPHHQKQLEQVKPCLFPLCAGPTNCLSNALPPSQFPNPLCVTRITAEPVRVPSALRQPGGGGGPSDVAACDCRARELGCHVPQLPFPDSSPAPSSPPKSAVLHKQGLRAFPNVC